MLYYEVMAQEKSLFISDMSLVGTGEEQISLDTANKNLHGLDEEIKSLSSKLDELMRKREKLAQVVANLQISDTIPSLELHQALIKPSDSKEEKAEFLLSLFSPRQDIYATRSKNKDGKTIYYPKCVNFWKPGCHRLNPGNDKTPCSGCVLNKKARLDVQTVINGNFRNRQADGKGAVGIYPLKEGNVTRFVAIDLDENDWMSASRSLLITARQLGIAMAVERSFSGNGAHLWIFFSHDIAAAKARRLASLLIDRTREQNPSLSMRSYDRLFPSQDALSQKGYGNLILLPLVASATDRGCTLFLDDDYQPYPAKEQVSYLSSLHRHSPAEIDALITSMEKSEASPGKPSLEEINPSWSRWIPSISQTDILKPIILYLSTGISLDKLALSPRAQEAFRRMATVANPSYYKELRKNDGYCRNLVSRIPLFEENDRVIKLPRGMLGNVRKYLEMNHIPFTLEDHRTAQTELKVSFQGKLRPYQEEAVDKTDDSCCGVIAAATGSGKTVMALAIIAKKRERTLIVVNSKTLLDQWRSAVESSLKIDEVPVGKVRRKRQSPIGTLDGSRGDKLTGIIDIAMLQSLSSHIEKGKEFKTGYGLVIVDECHHIAADKFRAVLKCFDAKYVYGLSATVKRADGLERIVFSECGNVLFSYDAARLAYSRGIAQYFIPRFLGTVLPENRMSFTALLNWIADNETRNAAIAEDVRRAYESGRSILVLTRRVEQNKAIARRLAELGVPSLVPKSTMKQGDMKHMLQEACALGHPVIIATDKLLGEGVDIPVLDTLVLASPFMQEGAIQQYAGRISRQVEGKKDTLIYDYADYLIPRLSYMYVKRLSVYKKLGYVPLSDARQPRTEMLFDNLSFSDTFLSDISKAEKSIIISASYIVESKLSNSFYDVLEEKADAQLDVRILFSKRSASFPSFKYVHDHLCQHPVIMEERENPVNYAVIDDLICWYGDFSLLGQGGRIQKDESAHSVLRIMNRDVAECFSHGLI